MAEMLVDRISAGKIYKKNDFTKESPLEYFNNGIAALIMHEASKDYLMMLLTMYAEKGEKETFRYLKRDLKEDISGYDRISPFEKTGPVPIG